MPTLEEYIDQAISDFDDIEEAIKEKGVDVPYGTDTKEYGNLIRGMAKGKPEQEKTVNITENGTTEVLPDEGSVLSKVTVNIDVEKEEIIKGITDFTNFWQQGRRSEIFDKVDTSDGLHFDYAFAGYDTMTRFPQHFNSANAQSMAYMCDGCSALTGIVRIETENCIDMQYVLRNCNQITEIYLGDTSAVEHWETAFAHCKGVTTIGKLNFGKSGYNKNTFTNCSALKNIEFEEILVSSSSLSFVNSQLLTVESLLSILNALSDNSGLETTYTVTLTSINLAKLSTSEKAIATRKNIELV